MNDQNSTAENVIEFPTPPAGIANAEPAPSKWVKTKFANLWRYTPTGKYYCRAKVAGKACAKSLDTGSLEIAKNKLDTFLMSERGKPSVEIDDENLTFANVVDEFVARLKNNPDVKTGTVEYKQSSIAAIRETWKGIDKIKVTTFTDTAVSTWAEKHRKLYSPTRYNGAVQTLRGIFQVAVDKGLLRENPARGRKRNSTKGIPMASVPITAPQLPETDQFAKILTYLDSHPARAHAAKMVRFLAYSGCRIGAARLIMPEHIDFKAGEITIPAIKYDKKPSRIPMIKEMRPLCEELIKDYPGTGSLLQIKNPKCALIRACKSIGIPPLKNHDLRHLFGTRALESGVDIKTCASWLGHVDGGRLLLQRYAHLRNEHSHEMAAKVSFSPVAPQ